MNTSGFSIQLLAAPLLAFVVTAGLTWWLVTGNVLRILDHPNHRSLHAVAVPRTGGLGIIAGVLVAWMILPAVLPVAVWSGVLLLALLSLTDDITGLPVWVRFLVHGMIASWLVVTLLPDGYGWPGKVVLTVGIVWLINLYNFMDGADGLAGGMTLIGFGCYGLMAWLAGNQVFALTNLCIAASAAAFLLFNFHPARIFMGDSGSIPLGFLAAASGIMGWINGLWSLWLACLVFSPFIADTSVTLVRRLLRGEKVWQAHREHYYQRLIRSGWSHRTTALGSYVLMAAAGGSAVWAAQQQGEASHQIAGLGWAGLYLLMIVVFDRYWHRHHGGNGKY